MKTYDIPWINFNIHSFSLTEVFLHYMKQKNHMIILLMGLMLHQVIAQVQTLPHQGGFYHPPTTVCLSSSERVLMKETIQQNIKNLEQQGLIKPISTRNNIMLSWPLKANDSYPHEDYHGISNFVDHDAEFPEKIADYHCGERSYDTNEGYNHLGTDFFLWPFAWNLMQANQIKVVAAAPGIIVAKLDGEPDNNCSLSTPAVWNAIFIQHEDGSQAWYGHLKKNSLTPKSIGETVEVGEFLGFVGSSGISNGPHLHLEIYDNEGKLIDPFQGECSSADDRSWWLEQRSYYDSGLNRISTHSAPPTLTACPDSDIINDKNEFCAEDTVFFAVFLRDQLAGQLLKHEVHQPDGTRIAAWPSTLQHPAHYAASYWYYPFILPSDASEGTWTYQVEYMDKVYTHSFTVCEPTFVDKISADFPAHSISPNPVKEHFQALIDIYIGGLFKFEIRDLTGRLVQTKIEELIIGRHQIDFNLPNLSNGLYLLSVADKNEAMVAQKFLKH